MNDKRNALEKEMRRSAFTGQRMDFAGMSGWSLSTRSRWIDEHVILRWVLLLAVLTALALIPASSQAATSADVTSGGSSCSDGFDHHNPAGSPYFDLLFTGKVWTEPKTGSVIAAVWIAECGRWLIGIWRNGYFTTHFLASWGYIINQLRGFVGASWTGVLLRSATFILIPCPGMYMGHPDAWVRPCPSGSGEQS